MMAETASIAGATPAPIVEVQQLSLEFATYRGAVRALDQVSLTVGAGEIVGLVGESGSGKSVTAMSVMRLLPPQAARITGGRLALLGQDVVAASEDKLEDVRGRLASVVFQEPMNALNPTIRIGRQITQVIRRHEAVSETEAAARAEALLSEMQVPDARRVMRNYPFELSGGMRQRVLIAMAFSCNPKVLIADEPTTALDVTVQAQVLALLRERARERGISVLFITHDLAVVAQLCDRVYVMYAGKVIEEGTNDAVLQQPLHPYSRALLRALPEFVAPKQPLASIPGTVPNLIHPPEGCRFRPRCDFAFERCVETPPLIEGPGQPRHRAACWLLKENRAAVLQPVKPGSAAIPAETARAEPLLGFENVHMRFPVGADWLGRPRGHVHALNGVDLEIRRGETLGIVGESGCGKSTLGQVAMALLKPTEGRVLFDDTDPWNLNGAELRRLRRRFQIVFQDPQSSLDPRMPVWQVMTEPLNVGERRSRGWLKDRAGALAEQVGLRRDQIDRYAHEFSGGQRQRIAIARALALEPDLIVLDEPTSALDVSVQAQILNLLMELQGRLNLTYLFVSHNVSVIRHIADRVAVMYLGQVVETGPAAALLQQPAHPYTRTLLAAVPTLDRSSEISAPLRNTDLPSAVNLPKGCFFRERCPFAIQGCEKPQALQATSRPDRFARCQRAEELLNGKI
jgi:peptide/nickel transport system ATP-binding protein